MKTDPRFVAIAVLVGCSAAFIIALLTGATSLLFEMRADVAANHLAETEQVYRLWLKVQSVAGDADFIKKFALLESKSAENSRGNEINLLFQLVRSVHDGDVENQARHDDLAMRIGAVKGR